MQRSKYRCIFRWKNLQHELVNGNNPVHVDFSARVSTGVNISLKLKYKFYHFHKFRLMLCRDAYQRSLPEILIEPLIGGESDCCRFRSITSKALCASG
jgi:hypothetical protein